MSRRSSQSSPRTASLTWFQVRSYHFTFLNQTYHLGSASLALQGAVLASAVLKNSAIVVKIPYARTDPWPETPDLRVIYFDMFWSTSY